MTTTATQPRQITDEQKLIAMQILEIAMSTPKEVAGIVADFDGNNNNFSVRAYWGGWESDESHPNGADFTGYFSFSADYEEEERSMELILKDLRDFLDKKPVAASNTPIF